jgi:hypothetical protein
MARKPVNAIDVSSYALSRRCIAIDQGWDMVEYIDEHKLTCYVYTERLAGGNFL